MEDDDRQADSDVESEDLAQVVELMRGVRKENVELKRNFESLKELHLQLSNSYKQLQSQYRSLHDERVSIERQYQALCESWRVELEEKQKQFEQAKAQILGPRDLELIRVKLLENLEGPYNLKCEVLAREAESAQQSFVRQRREYEELQASYKNLESRSQSERDALLSEYTTIIAELKDRIAKLGQPQAKVAQLEAQNKALLRERSDLAYTISKLQEEIEDLRRMKERANVEKDSIALRVERKVKAIQAEELELSGLVESLTRKNRHLQKELAEAHRANEDMFGQLLKLQNTQMVSQTQIDNLRTQRALESASLEDQHREAVQKLEDQVSALRDELHSKERQVAELHLSHQEQVTHLIEGHDRRLAQAEKEHNSKARALKDHNTELAAKVQALQDALDELQRECDEHRAKAAKAAESAAQQLQQLQASLAGAQHQAAGTAAELSECKKELDKTKNDLLRLKMADNQRTAERQQLEVQLQRLQEEQEQATAARQALAKELEDAKRKAEVDRAAHVLHIESSHQAFSLEKSTLVKRYQAALQELSLKHEAETKRLKRRVKDAKLNMRQLEEELTDMRLRVHELEAGGLLPDVFLPRDAATASTPPGTATQASKPSALSPGILGELAALRQRQQDYLHAASTALGMAS